MKQKISRMGNETRKDWSKRQKVFEQLSGRYVLGKLSRKSLSTKARRALCVRGLFRKVIGGPGSRAMHISGWHSRWKDLKGRSRCRKTVREIVFVFWRGFFFFKGASGGEENKRGWCVSHSVRNRSFVDLRFHKFVFLSFFRHPPPSSSKTCLRTTRVCESLQLAARESISIRGKGIYSFTNETSCRYEALFQINSSGPLVQPDDNIDGYNALCPFLVSDIFMRKRTTRLC